MITRKDLELSADCGILRLTQAKSGQRSGSGEAIALRDHLTLQLLDTWVAVARPSAHTMLWPHSGHEFWIIFRRYLQHLRPCHLCFTPYSLRRGGATYLLQAGLPMEDYGSNAAERQMDIYFRRSIVPTR